MASPSRRRPRSSRPSRDSIAGLVKRGRMRIEPDRLVNPDGMAEVALSHTQCRVGERMAFLGSAGSLHCNRQRASSSPCRARSPAIVEDAGIAGIEPRSLIVAAERGGHVAFARTRGHVVEANRHVVRILAPAPITECSHRSRYRAGSPSLVLHMFPARRSWRPRRSARLRQHTCQPSCRHNALAQSRADEPGLHPGS